MLIASKKCCLCYVSGVGWIFFADLGPTYLPKYPPTAGFVYIQAFMFAVSLLTYEVCIYLNDVTLR